MATSTYRDTPIVLTIAGSDSSGGAGIQADIKAISATGAYACSVITALTAQNTRGVSSIFPIAPLFVEQQLDAVFTDLSVAAVKIGMLADAEIIHSVTKKLRQYKPKSIVVDPVMVATSGDRLLEPDAMAALKDQLLPLASVITPNLPEGAALIGETTPTNQQEMDNLIDKLKALKIAPILLKGGHLENSPNSCDLLITESDIQSFQAKRISTSNTHGTGCTLSSAIASYLAQGYPISQAIELAKHYITQAITHADRLEVGAGHGPVNHFYMFSQR
ncbi:bifunctional hydroxymethylpyrimidine kinase/phosphomethylpyrimidine kinase [Vibrio sp. ZSDZ34]|uniref:hydroxymethylpyrimidine kinase n=1 Tax=Vibrio gelatinilyticus TaxID=2893468 RepID=A0A9X2AXI3_9VIBR|nr:bifunctional hydroxymethylpyrimidine kinase/phosphomethylpyrimidine kinase [Vibrio gelatinilyticus]MCJ2378415.1 bifunctional hydroxymethylpyrimidine kinase/phosphomethylpyrimidine kinase [Vibrio gelatinilyticus]